MRPFTSSTLLIVNSVAFNINLQTLLVVPLELLTCSLNFSCFVFPRRFFEVSPVVDIIVELFEPVQSPMVCVFESPNFCT